MIVPDSLRSNWPVKFHMSIHKICVVVNIHPVRQRKYDPGYPPQQDTLRTICHMNTNGIPHLELLSETARVNPSITQSITLTNYTPFCHPRSHQHLPLAEAPALSPLRCQSLRANKVAQMMKKGLILSHTRKPVALIPASTSLSVYYPNQLHPIHQHLPLAEALLILPPPLCGVSPSERTKSRK